jgi:diguanylate cyclase (GGDEF)-like protein
MAMYRAKAAGRDRIEFYSPELRDWALARKTSVESLAVRVQQLQDENRALAEAVTTDFRTGLANTAAFESDHARLFALFAPSQQAYAVLLADIDHFHDYNSAYGYRRGNEALRRVATTLASALRQGDRAYRYGGEEFDALLPRTRLDGALVVAERVQAEVEALGLEHPTNPGGVVTVTIGVNEAGKSHAKPEDVFDSVNALLLHGKDSGRNRVVSPRDVPGECGET